MHPLLQEFVSKEEKHFRFKVGEHIASALAGFVAGVVIASIAFVLILYFIPNIR